MECVVPLKSAHISFCLYGARLKNMTDHATLWSPETLLSQTLCSHAKGSFFFEGWLECLCSTIREMCHSQSFLTSCLWRNISTHISFWQIQTDWQCWRVLAHGLFICQEKYVQIPPGFLSVSGQFWKDWLVSHREPTCPPARFSFNFWPWVKMAASHTGRLGSQSDQFSGPRETSASLPLCLSSSLSLTVCLEHADRVTEMASCASSCCALISRFKGSRVSLCLDGKGEGNEALLHLGWIPVQQTQTRLISPFTFTVLAPVWQLTLSFLLKRNRISLKILSVAARHRALHSVSVTCSGDCNLLQHCWQRALFYLHLQLHKVGFLIAFSVSLLPY